MFNRKKETTEGACTLLEDMSRLVRVPAEEEPCCVDKENQHARQVCVASGERAARTHA
jgi:hypothetical protein